jgi:hypothetical protein
MSKTKKALKAAGSSAVGAGAGYAAMEAGGMAALGLVGEGAGIGCAAGPAGAVAGAILGLAAFGVYCIFAD